MEKKILHHYKCYAAFSTPEEYRLEHAGKLVGMLPVLSLVVPGDYLIFAGRRWLINDVDDERKVISITPAKAGRTPMFLGEGFPLYDMVAETMRDCYIREAPPRYLDATGQALFQEGASAFTSLDLGHRCVLPHDGGITLFPWAGSLVLDTLRLLLQRQGLQVGSHRFALMVSDASPDSVRHALKDLTSQPAPPPEELAAVILLKAREKYDRYLGEAMLNLEYASRALRAPQALHLARALLTDPGWS